MVCNAPEEVKSPGFQLGPPDKGRTGSGEARARRKARVASATPVSRAWAGGGAAPLPQAGRGARRKDTGRRGPTARSKRERGGTVPGRPCPCGAPPAYPIPTFPALPYPSGSARNGSRPRPLPPGPGFPSSPVPPPRRAHPQAAKESAPLGGGGGCWSGVPSRVAETAARPGCSRAAKPSLSGRLPAPSRSGTSGRPDPPALNVLAPSVWAGAGAPAPGSRSTPVGLLVQKPGALPPRRRARGGSPRACSPVSPR